MLERDSSQEWDASYPTVFAFCLAQSVLGIVHTMKSLNRVHWRNPLYAILLLFFRDCTVNYCAFLQADLCGEDYMECRDMLESVLKDCDIDDARMLRKGFSAT